MAAAVEKETVDDIFRARMMNSIDWLVRELTITDKKEVAAAADVPRLIIALARNTPTADPEDRVASERLSRTIQFKRDLIKRAGGVLSVKEVQSLLGYGSPQAVHKAIDRGSLLALIDGRKKLLPALQFDGKAILPAIPQLLAATPTTSGWALLQFLVEGDEGLGDDRPLDLIRGDAADIARLVRYAGTLEV